MTDTTSADGNGDALRAMLRVEPHEAAGCAVLSAGERGADVVRSGGCTHEGEDDTCRAAVTVAVDGVERREYVEGAVSDHCICPAFDEARCAGEIVGFRKGALVVSVTVPDRAALRNLVDALRRREASVHLEQVLPLDTTDDGRAVPLDVGAITEKQREAIGAAVELGYYERPRHADLEDVAEALGVSPSATSQRLNTAETTLVQAFVDASALDGLDGARNGGSVVDGGSEEPERHRAPIQASGSTPEESVLE